MPLHPDHVHTVHDLKRTTHLMIDQTHPRALLLTATDANTHTVVLDLSAWDVRNLHQFLGAWLAQIPPGRAPDTPRTHDTNHNPET
jgi:hypothetical protein